MYNIKQAAARAGVTVPVLRAWERRYGIVEPARTASGYRQFDDAAVARVRTMRALVDAGWAPSTAAASILAGESPLVADAGPDVALDANAVATSPDVTDRFVEAAGELDPGALETVLDDTFARTSFERAATDSLFPALRALGDAWASGAVSVAGEHLASAAVHRRLGRALDAAGRSTPGRRGDIVVGMPPGGRHELGALAFAVAARRAGLPVTYLGPDLPIEDWLRSATGAAAAVIGMVTSRDRAAGLDIANRLREADPALVIALGGPAAPSSSADLDVIVLPSPLVEAVEAVGDAIAQREGRALP
ncbi:MAG TPA: MerR family transcriptional regulator [Candidatus Limnocylindrales bacterium]|nr:MerR family transcriptional regulator [Candidatus Limnocylindrales bacterium]